MGGGGIQNRPAAGNGNLNGNRNGNFNGNTNVNRNWSTDIDVDNGWGGGYGWGAAAAGAAVGAAAGYAAGASYGSVVYALPAGCTTSYVNGVTYSNCGGVWYEPSFSGSSVSYTVANAP